MIAVADAPVFQVGGALWDESPTYVRRRADDQLLEALSERRYCYVLTARQMGKSSLRVQATKALIAAGTRVGVVDVSTLQRLEERNWYWAFIGKLMVELRLPRSTKLDELRSELGTFAGPEVLSRFISDILLATLTDEVVIFIEEVDSVLNLPFSIEGFFATLRECHERRPLDARYRGLTFVLIGVANSTELARDPRTTPFNIAQKIELAGFTSNELGPLRKQLPRPLDRDDVVERLLYWTGGQPFLTHKLCQLLSTAQIGTFDRAGGAVAIVDEVLERNILTRWEEQDTPEHLRTIRDRIDARFTSDQVSGSKMLTLYETILDSVEGVTPDQSLLELELRLTGLVVVQGDRLRSANEIYRRVFGRAWIGSQLARLRPYDEALTAWKRSGKRDESRLLEGHALNEGLSWAEGRALPETEREFLHASKLGAERKSRRKQAMGLVTIGVLVAALGGSILLEREATKQAALAQQETERANREAEEAKIQASRAQRESERASEEAKRATRETRRANAEAAQATELRIVASEQAQLARQESDRAKTLARDATRAALDRDKEARRALAAEREASERAKRIQVESDQVSMTLAACTLENGERARLRAEVARLTAQCSRVADAAVPWSNSEGKR